MMIAIGSVVVLGAAYLIFSGGFVYLLFKNNFEIKDGKVFYHVSGIGNMEVVGADAATFKRHPKNGDYGMDQNNLYFKDRVISGADRDSFEILRHKYWSKDKSKAYYGADVVEGLDPSHLKFINEHFITDGTSVYSAGKRLDGVDLASFEIVPGQDTLAKDKNHYYSLDERGKLVNGSFVSDVDELERSKNEKDEESN